MIPGSRDLAVLAFADELSTGPALLSAWSAAFGAADDATLVIFAPGWTGAEVETRLGDAIATAGLGDDATAADLLALPGEFDEDARSSLAEDCAAVLTATEPAAPFGRLRRVDSASVVQLRDLLPAKRLDMTSGAAARVSRELLAFSMEAANERRTILEFMVQISDELRSGERVLDVGAGEQPYRELFGHVDYVTADWANSVHTSARHDIIAPAHDLPVADASFDAVINTQVLEHVPNPGEVVAELYRVLRPGGRLFMTLPLAWELHEEPFDFYRYTRYGISHLLREAGFTDIDARPRNDIFSTIAQLMRNSYGAMGRAPDGRDPEREQAGRAMAQMADIVQGFAELDARWTLPLGYAIRAQRPETPGTLSGAGASDQSSAT